MIKSFESDEDGVIVRALESKLSQTDEAVILPQAYISCQRECFKNVVFRFDGKQNTAHDLFSEDWFGGVSAVVVSERCVLPILSDPKRRESALNLMKAAVCSEMLDEELQVGPELDGDVDDRDTTEWTCGFDAPNCCVGIYSSDQSYSSDQNVGMERAHPTYFLVCRAGGGTAAQTFHSRLTEALSKGASLADCLSEGGCPGARALRRVSTASARNRARILASVANVLEWNSINTISDNVAVPSAPSRQVVVDINVQTNVLRAVDNHVFQYATCVDSLSSQGLATTSNIHQGITVFTDTNDGFKFKLRNPSHNCIPFSSERICKDRDALRRATVAHIQTKKNSGPAHPDHDWVHARFGWKNNEQQGQVACHVEPPVLWGTHRPQRSVSDYGRELGLSQLKSITLRPEIVVIPGLDGSQSKAFARQMKLGGLA